MSYWTSRKNLPYYITVRHLLESMGPMGSLLDVGSWDTLVATWGDFDQRWTVDLRSRPPLIEVTPIVGRWPDCATLVPVFDVVTCLQVLEHVDEPESFARALFDHARQAVIISVPWGWPAGAEASHLHDPIDRAKLRAWTGREPTILTVTDGNLPRAVALYGGITSAAVE